MSLSCKYIAFIQNIFVGSFLSFRVNTDCFTEMQYSNTGTVHSCFNMLFPKGQLSGNSHNPRKTVHLAKIQMSEFSAFQCRYSYIQYSRSFAVTCYIAAIQWSEKFSIPKYIQYSTHSCNIIIGMFIPTCPYLKSRNSCEPFVHTNYSKYSLQHKIDRYQQSIFCF